MTLTLLDRRATCQRSFWMYRNEDVVVRCTRCQRLYHMPYRFVVRQDGLVLIRNARDASGTPACRCSRTARPWLSWRHGMGRHWTMRAMKSW